MLPTDTGRAVSPLLPRLMEETVQTVQLLKAGLSHNARLFKTLGGLCFSGEKHLGRESELVIPDRFISSLPARCS